jgi:hypothetical protein
LQVSASFLLLSRIRKTTPSFCQFLIGKKPPHRLCRWETTFFSVANGDRGGGASHFKNWDGNGKEDNHPRLHPPLADVIHPSNGGELTATALRNP